MTMKGIGNIVNMLPIQRPGGENQIDNQMAEAPLYKTMRCL